MHCIKSDLVSSYAHRISYIYMTLYLLPNCQFHTVLGHRSYQHNMLVRPVTEHNIIMLEKSHTITHINLLAIMLVNSENQINVSLCGIMLFLLYKNVLHNKIYW